MPHQHLTHIFLVSLCHESRYFKDIVKFGIFRLRRIYNFFQVCLDGDWMVSGGCLEQRRKKYFIFCQPDKKIENFLPHSRNLKWGLWIYIWSNHIIYINLDTFNTIMSIFTSYFIKLMDYTQTISIFKKYFLPNFEFRNIFCHQGWQDLPLFPPLVTPPLFEERVHSEMKISLIKKQ